MLQYNHFITHYLSGGIAMKWAYLVHIGFNMWREEKGPLRAAYTNASPYLRFDQPLWDELLVFAKEHGIDTIVMDLGEGIRYESHPEIAVEGSWSIQKLRDELKKMKSMDITPIPKLNFSASHDEWLGDYSRCVSSKLYYQVCADLISEVCDVFETPELFHLGMDEERDDYAQYWGYSVMRHGDFWWNDFYFFLKEVEKNNVRPWIWSDSVWKRPNEFIKKMPKEVMQSNWYYGDFLTDTGKFDKMITSYDLLDQHGYDQIPCGMNLSILRNVKYCMDHISQDHLKGFLQTSWMPTLLTRKYNHLSAMDALAQAKKGYEGDESMFCGWTGKCERPCGYGAAEEIDVIF